MDILDLLRSDGSIVVNKALAKEIGLVEAVVYSEVVSLYQYWKRGGNLNGGFFFTTYQYIGEQTGLSESTVKRKVSDLEKLGLLETKLMGHPAKKFYRVTDKILSLVRSEWSTLSGQNDLTKGGQNELPSQVKLTQHNNTKINNTQSNNTNPIISHIAKLVLTASQKELLARFVNSSSESAERLIAFCDYISQYNFNSSKYILKAWEGFNTPQKSPQRGKGRVRVEKLPEWFVEAQEEVAVNEPEDDFDLEAEAELLRREIMNMKKN